MCQIRGKLRSPDRTEENEILLHHPSPGDFSLVVCDCVHATETSKLNTFSLFLSYMHQLSARAILCDCFHLYSICIPSRPLILRNIDSQEPSHETTICWLACLQLLSTLLLAPASPSAQANA